jgi:hypothetical protein
LESVDAPQLRLVSRPIEVRVTLGVAPWLTVAAVAAPVLPAAAFVVQYAQAVAAVPAITIATTTGASR